MSIKTLKGCHLLTMGKVHRKKKIININKVLKGRDINMGQLFLKKQDDHKAFLNKQEVE